MNLFEVSKGISDRLISTFTRDGDGKRPVFGGSSKTQNDPHCETIYFFTNTSMEITVKEALVPVSQQIDWTDARINSVYT